MQNGGLEDPSFDELATAEPAGEIGASNEAEEAEMTGVDELPLFASKEAKALHARIKETALVADKHSAEIAQLKLRLKVMQEHASHVTQEVQHSNALMSSKRKEVLSEQHLKQLSTRQLGKLQSESVQLRAQMVELQEQLNSAQQRIFRANEQMDTFKMQMNWSQQELEQWVTAAKQKDEDAMALEKYTKSDDNKVKELSLHVERMNSELAQQQANLANETTITQSKQIELDRLAEEFREMHASRQELVQRWQDAIEAMHRRDEEINAIGEQYAAAKKARAERESVVNEAVEQLKTQQRENRSAETQADELARALGKRRDEYVAAVNNNNEFKNQLEALKGEMAAAAEHLARHEAENLALERTLEAKKAQLSSEREKCERAKVLVQQKKKRQVVDEAAIAEAENKLKELEAQLPQADAQMRNMKEAHFREAQTLQQLRNQELIAKADVSGANSTLNNLRDKLHQLDKRSQRQQELLYNAEFQVQQMERKVARSKGERSEEETLKLKAIISELEVELSAKQKRKAMLAGQMKKLNSDVKRSEHRLEEAKNTKALLSEQIAALEQDNTGAQQQLRQVEGVRNQAMVENDLLRLEVKRLRQQLLAHTDELFNQRNKKQQLELSMAEKREEISLHKDLLRQQLRSLDQDQHRLTLELRGREQHINRLEARYETRLQARGGEEDGHSNAFYVIKAAQKREELQRRGDELDAQIRTVEQEIRYLQRALDDINGRNVASRDSAQKASQDSSEVAELQSLEKQAQYTQEIFTRKRKELRQLTADCEDDQQRLGDLNQQLQQLADQNGHLAGQKQGLEEKVLRSQEELIGTEEQIHEHINKHRATFETTNETIEEKVLRLEMHKLAVSEALKALARVASENPEIKETLELALQACQLRLPKQPRSALSRDGAYSSAGARRAAQAQNYSRSARTQHRPSSSMSQKSNVSQRSNSSVPVKTFDLHL